MVAGDLGQADMTNILSRVGALLTLFPSFANFGP